MSLLINPYAHTGVVRNGLQLYLDAGNPQSYPGSGTGWTDLVNGYVFSLSGSGTTFVDADAASYFLFNGSGYLTQAAAYAGSIMRKFGRQNQPGSLIFWLYRGATASTDEGMFGTITSGAHNGVDSYIDSTGNTPRFTPRPLGADINGSVQIAVGAWKQVVFAGQADGATTCTWYTNGAANGTGTLNNSGWTAGDSSLLPTLCSNQGGSNFQNGSRISKVLMYERVITPAEVLLDFNYHRIIQGI